MAILIRGGRVIDPKNKVDKVLDVYIDQGQIKKIGRGIKKDKKTRILNAKDLWVIPGIIDMHVHLREPGREYKEDIISGTKAAAQSGITSVACMPNTDPPIDNISAIRFICSRAEESGYIKVYPIGAVTKGLNGKDLAEIGSMALAGAVAISDDGFPVMNAQLYRQAMEYAKIFNLLIIDHSEDLELSKNGQVNKGFMAAKMGLMGIPREAEYTMVARNIGLAELTGCRLHLAHLSTKESVEIVRRAKRKNKNITAETCPHYFTITEEILENYNSLAKVKPPIRTPEDKQAIIKGLQDGTIDVIASDHAPHTREEKEMEFNRVPFGMIGMETELPLTITELVLTKKLKPIEAVAKLTVNPANILKLSAGTLSINAPADIALVDIKQKKIVKNFFSKSSNSPFIGRELFGWAVTTILNGKIIMHRGNLVSD
ncbi:MAG: dihydroorotase [bacterium]